MPDDISKLREDLNQHKVDDARFEASTAAYIKNAAEDIRDITGRFTKANDAQLLAMKGLTDGLAAEREQRKVELVKEATAREVEDTRLKGRIDGYAKVVGGIAFFLGVAATILRLVGMI
ncbi:hypothetical protein LCGC14_1464620 [marine sediment metagenome]|uniref:Uncharacterized protein n=1 Tax=marine sediment metagenome TaxID=412755 RepID=A0A0F9LUM6_9ZZZZ